MPALFCRCAGVRWQADSPYRLQNIRPSSRYHASFCFSSISSSWPATDGRTCMTIFPACDPVLGLPNVATDVPTHHDDARACSGAQWQSSANKCGGAGRKITGPARVHEVRNQKKYITNDVPQHLAKDVPCTYTIYQQQLNDQRCTPSQHQHTTARAAGKGNVSSNRRTTERESSSHRRPTDVAKAGRPPCRAGAGID